MLELLDPATGVVRVAVQHDAYEGADDVVVVHDNRRVELIQVKHSADRDENFSHADLLRQQHKKDGKWGRSVLQKLIAAHRDAVRDGLDPQPSVITNRKALSSQSTLHDPSVGKSISIPPLDRFLDWVRLAANAATSLNDFEVPDDFADVWSVWCRQFLELNATDNQVGFLKAFHVVTDHPDLGQLEAAMHAQLVGLVGGSIVLADRLRDALLTQVERWSSQTMRKGAFVDREQFRSALNLDEDSAGPHEFAPPSPFFESREEFCNRLEVELRARSHAFIFLTSMPGGGKTSVVSHLANRRESVIDARFHAYKPIDPSDASLPADAGVATSAKVLWRDLFVQIKKQISQRGWLTVLDVPICGSWLSAEALRSQVFRLASALAKRLGRVFVIALDGLDHAARASESGGKELLDSLPRPDLIPEDVCLLLAGQPPTSWPEYPEWLINVGQHGTTIDVPAITVDDVGQLLSELPSSIDVTYLEATARLISGYAKGSTLAAVYAVREVLDCSTIAQLEERLRARQLAPALEAYYAAIWRHCVEDASAAERAAVKILECCLWLSAVRITPDFLASTFSDLNLAAPAWRELLMRLAPLVVEEHDGFRILNNDVRVHLHSRVRGASGVVPSVSGQLISGLLKSRAYYPTLVVRGAELFRHAGRESTAVDLIESQFVTDSWNTGTDIPALSAFVRFACANAHDFTSVDELHRAILGIDSLNQLDWCVGDDAHLFADDAAKDLGSDVLPSERRVAPQHEWDPGLLSNVLWDASQLDRRGHTSRARSLIVRWFGGLTVNQIVEATLSIRPASDKHWEQDRLVEQVSSLCRLLGEAMCLYGLRLNQERKFPVAKKSHGGEEREVSYLAHLGSGVIEFACGCRTSTDAYRAVRYACSIGYYIDQGLGSLRALLERGDWRRASVVAHAWPDDLLTKPSGLSLVIRAVRGLRAGFDQPAPTVEELGASITRGVDSSRYGGWIEGAWAFLRAIKCPGESPLEIASTCLGASKAGRHDDRQDKILGQMAIQAATLGRWVLALQDKQADAEVQVPLTELRKTIDAFLNPGFRTVPMGSWLYFQWLPAFLRGALDIAFHLGGQYRDSVTDMLLSAMPMDGFPIYAAAATDWMRQNHVKELFEDRLLPRLQPGGFFTRTTTSERAEMALKVAHLAKQLGWKTDPASIAFRARQLCIGYVSRKDYSFGPAVEYFKQLARVEPQSWSTLGREMLELSERASELGENRSHGDVEGALADAVVRHGPMFVLQLAEGRTSEEAPLGLSETWFFRGLVEAKTFAQLDDEPILCLLCLAVGLFDWRLSGERETLLDVIRSAQEVAMSRRSECLKDALAGHFRFYANLSTDSRFAEQHRDSIGPDGDELRAVEELANRLAGKLSTLTSALREIESIREQLASLDGYAATRRLAGVVKVIWAGTASLGGEERVVIAKQLFKVTGEICRYEVIHSGLRPILGEIVRELPDAACLEWITFRFRAVCKRPNEEGLDERGRIRHLLSDGTWILRVLARRGNAVESAKLLRAELVNHRLWQSGTFNAVQLQDLPALRQGVSWVDTVCNLLVRQVRSEATYVSERALRGLHALVASFPGSLDHLLRHASSQGYLTRLEMLKIVEVEYSKGALGTAGDQFVADCLGDSRLALRLAAWVATRGWEVNSNPLKPTGNRSTGTTLGGRGPLVLPSQSKGGQIFAPAYQATLNRVRYIEEVLQADLSNLVPFLRSSPREWEPPLLPKPGRTVTEGLRPHYDDDFGLFEAIETQADAQGFDTEEVVRIAQAVLPTDEPKMLAHDPLLWTGRVSIPIDKEAEALISQGKFPGHCREAITALKSSDEVVLGARIVTYMWGRSAEFRLQTWMLDGRSIMSTRKIATCLSGRCAFFPLASRFEPHERVPINQGVPLVYFAGGMGWFPEQSMVLAPSLLWNRNLGWQPSRSTPFEWHDASGKVAWFQRYSLPIRSVAQSMLHEQPQIDVWLANRKAVEVQLARLGCRLSEIEDVVVRKDERGEN